MATADGNFGQKSKTFLALIHVSSCFLISKDLEMSQKVRELINSFCFFLLGWNAIEFSQELNGIS